MKRNCMTPKAVKGSNRYLTLKTGFGEGSKKQVEGTVANEE